MPESMSKKMIIHITPVLHRRINTAAKEAGVSMAEFIRTSVVQRLDIESANLILLDKNEEKTREY